MYDILDLGDEKWHQDTNSVKKKQMQIIATRKANKDKRAEIRLKALELRARGLQSEDVAKATGFHAAYITTLVRKYRQGGLEAIAGNHYGGNRRNMSVEKEDEILAPFKERAKKGEIIEVGEIKAAYQAEVDHPIGNSQIYFVLHRHGQRKEKSWNLRIMSTEGCA